MPATTESRNTISPEKENERPFKKIVLTGGPCAGKSVVSEGLREIYGDRMVVVPEAATVLFEGGFPLAGRDLEYSDEWRICAQTAIFNLQLSLEAAAEMQARQSGAEIVLCDRGIFDNEAYAPGLIADQCARSGIDYSLLAREYDGVIHLESLAVDPASGYGDGGNSNRLEDRQEALELNGATRHAWESIGQVSVIPPAESIEDKTVAVAEAIEGYASLS